MARFLARFLDLFLRPNCPLCDRPAEDEFCSACWHQLNRTRLKNPHQFWRGDLPVFAWGRYEGTLKRSIAALKYEGRPQLARPLGHAVGRAWSASPPLKSRRFVVVPIPMHSEKQRKRGFNQAELLARHFCEVTRFPLQSRGLTRVRNTKPLFELNREERRQVLENAIDLGEPFRRRPPQHPVLLFDDIYTTGTTVREAFRTLQNCGISVAGVVVLSTPGDRRSLV
ncbi:MAG: ComF family protein [Cyanobacteria bacterium SID2]|nr:ComF family protein [Cyanobacteria bacterium SID2]MBP0004202.1 ComF family protein [Cyanobacteria bacterium SBC]